MVLILRLFDFEKLKTLLESSNRKVTKNCCDTIFMVVNSLPTEILGDAVVEVKLIEV